MQGSNHSQMPKPLSPPTESLQKYNAMITAKIAKQKRRTENAFKAMEVLRYMSPSHSFHKDLSESLPRILNEKTYLLMPVFDEDFTDFDQRIVDILKNAHEIVIEYCDRLRHSSTGAGSAGPAYSSAGAGSAGPAYSSAGAGSAGPAYSSAGAGLAGAKKRIKKNVTFAPGSKNDPQANPWSGGAALGSGSGGAGAALGSGSGGAGAALGSGSGGAGAALGSGSGGAGAALGSGSRPSYIQKSIDRARNLIRRGNIQIAMRNVNPNSRASEYLDELFWSLEYKSMALFDNPIIIGDMRVFKKLEDAYKNLKARVPPRASLARKGPTSDW